MLVYLATQKDKEPISVKKIAEHEDVSIKYTEQIIRSFMRKKLLTVVRGSKGGYVIKPETLKLTAKDIFVLLENEAFLIECLDEKNCNCLRKENCSTFELWNGLENAIFDYLNSFTIEDLAKGYLINSLK